MFTPSGVGPVSYWIEKPLQILMFLHISPSITML